MLTDTYFKRVSAVCVALLTLIIGLSFLLYNHGPRVRLVQFSQDISETSLTTGSTVSIVFDRPLEQKDYSEFITLSPAVEFEANTGVQNITLTLHDNLRHDRDYSIRVQPEIYDRSGKKMKTKYEHSFTSSTPSYVYLERNYGPDTDTSFYDVDSDDHIKLARLGSDAEIVFSHPNIRSFVANKNYILVVVKKESRDDLFSINLATNEIRHENLILGGHIGNLTLGQRGQVALFTVQPDFSSVSSEYYDKFANRVESLDLASGDMLSLTNQSGEYIKAYEIHLDNDGQVALIQDQVQTYYAVSPFNDYDPVLIGAHTSSFGFNSTASEILFRDREDFVRYNVQTSEVTRIELDKDGYDSYIQQLSARNRKIFASQTSRALGKSLSQIGVYTDWGAEATIAWSTSTDDNRSMREFSESYDDSLLAIQLNPESCQYDDIGDNSQCKTTSTVIYDIEANEVVEDFPGFNLVWLP